MSGRLQTLARACCLVLSLCGSACSENEQGPAISVEIATDLPLELLDVVSVQSLAAQGDVAIETGWFNIQDGCTATEDGFRVLGSFGVPKVQQDFARLSIVGYKRTPENVLVPVVQQRVEAVYGTSITPASVKLSRSCANGPRCPADQTCGAGTGQCEMVATFRDDKTPPPAIAKTCLQTVSAESVGRPTPTVRETAPACGSIDSVCPSDCDWTRDDDCRIALGKTCDPLKPPPCRANGVCVDRVCCEQRCEGECLRCDLPSTPGMCSHVPYLPGAAPLGEPDLQLQCASDHVKISCSASSCVPSCEDGWAACDAPFASAGCTTKLGDAKHCKNCTDPCAYGYCGPDGCVWHHSLPKNPDGKANTADSAPVSANKRYARGVAIPPGDRKLRGLGALVHPSIAGRLLRLALYVQTASTVDLFAFTPDLKTVDRKESLVEVAAGALRVEALLDTPKPLKYGDYYMIAFEVSDDTQLFTTAEPAMLWNVEPGEYGEFPQQLSLASNDERLPNFQVYVVTTPD